MDLGLLDRVAIVTGASSGIGMETASQLASAGAQVVLVGRDTDRLEDVTRRLRADGAEATAIRADLEEADAAEEVAAAAVERFGRIDLLVHSAGIFEPAPLRETPDASFERQWRVNVRAPFQLSKLAVPHMPSGSAIVFISSTVAHTGFAACAAYSATKGAVEAMARALSAELAPGIRVNAIAPGFVRTPMVTRQLEGNPDMEGGLLEKTPVGFIGRPEDIGRLVAFVCSPLSAYTHGSTLVVDGGWTAKG